MALVETLVSMRADTALMALGQTSRRWRAITDEIPYLSLNKTFSYDETKQVTRTESLRATMMLSVFDNRPAFLARFLADVGTRQRDALGPLVNDFLSDSLTPLMHACRTQSGAQHVLVRAGANEACEDPLGHGAYWWRAASTQRPALSVAARAGHLYWTDFLLRFQTEPVSSDVLIHAAGPGLRSEETSTWRYLGRSSRLTWSSHDVASGAGRRPDAVLDLILAHGSFSQREVVAATVHAIRTRHTPLSAVRKLLSHLQMDDSSVTDILCAAAGSGKMFVLEHLLGLAGADVNRADNNGHAAAHHAAINGQPRALALLLAQGADPLRCSSGAMTLAHTILDIGDTFERDENMESCVYAEYSAGHREAADLLVPYDWPAEVIEAAWQCVDGQRNLMRGITDDFDNRASVLDAVDGIEASFEARYPAVHAARTPLPPSPPPPELPTVKKKFGWKKLFRRR